MIPGSFDPITIGHYDLAMRAERLFDEVWFVLTPNSSKRYKFTAEQRLEMLDAAFKGHERIRTGICEGLLVDYAAEHDITALVKGARNTVDFDYELSMALINRSIGNDIETIILPTRSELMHISSTMVSELMKYGRPYGNYVPEGVEELIRKYTK